jgi:acetylornithine deacetylase/succinyl-diaminopimelate desuccinylase family protein
MDALKTLRDLIAIPSVNPMRPDSCEAAEQAATGYLESLLRRNQIDCERQTVVGGRENLIAVVHPSSGPSAAGGLLLNSHLDTVPVANMAINPFDPVLKDGRVFGRGACDAKASIAAMLAALLAHAQRPVRPRPVLLLATVDEEFSFAGSRRFIERRWPVSAAVVGEPTELANVIAHKGVVRWRLQVRGVSAHGATPELGRNAIYDGARLAVVLEQYASDLSRRARHPLLQHPTLNVGRVTGGQAVNMVPDRCEFEIDRRMLPGESAVEALKDCENWLRTRLEGIDFILEDPFLDDPPLETSADSAMVRSLQDAQQSVLGTISPCVGAHYGTDGSKLAAVGIETVVCGPGNIAQAHTKDEFVEVEQVNLAVRLYDQLIQDWGN